MGRTLNGFDYIIDAPVGQLSELHGPVGAAREQTAVLVDVEVRNTHSYVAEYCVALVFARKRVERDRTSDRT